jgi:hypothetical protein
MQCSESKAWEDATVNWQGYGLMASVFWDACGICGIIFMNYLEKGQTIIREYYIALLERFNDEIKKKRVHLKKKKCCFIKTMRRVTNQSKRR